MTDPDRDDLTTARVAWRSVTIRATAHCAIPNVQGSGAIRNR